MNVKFVIKYLYLHYTLLNHIKTVHDKIRSFVCTQCDKTFYENCTLTVHLRTHTKEKPYQCLFCDKSFTSSSNRSFHEIRIHTKKFPHVCEICKKGFIELKRLKKHLKKLH